MGIDINKILQEATASEEENQNQNQDQNLNEGDQNQDTQTQDQNVNTENQDEQGLPNSIYASAVSAGLGALSLRNRLRGLNESGKKR